MAIQNRKVESNLLEPHFKLKVHFVNPYTILDIPYLTAPHTAKQN